MSPRDADTNQVLDHFEALWKGGQPPTLEDFLPPGDTSAGRQLAWELSKLDLWYRVRAGEVRPVVDRYFRLPGFAWTEDEKRELRELEEEYRYTPAAKAMADWNQSPDAENSCPRDETEPLQWPAVPLPPPPATVPASALGGTSEALPTHIGRYPITGLIGQGGMGIVYCGRDEELQRLLAVKVLLPGHAANPDLRQRFLTEANLMGRLQHPGVAPIHEVGDLPDGRPFFSMKQVQGETLAALLKRRRAPDHDQTTSLRIFAEVCQTLAYAHAQRVIHRDLKPENIMVGKFGEVQVMDWGLAKELGQAASAEGGRPSGNAEAGADGRTVPGAIMGTPAYMPPEQARGDLDLVDTRSDVFGLGAILCEILTGAPPYRGGRLREILAQAERTNLDDAHERLGRCVADAVLVELCRRCLAPEPEGRPADAGAVAAALDAYQARVRQRLQQAEIDRTAAQVKAAEERKRRRLNTALFLAVLALVVGLGGAAVWYTEYHAQQQLRQAAQATQDRQLNKEVQAALADAARLLGEIDEQLADPVKTSVLLSNPERQCRARIDEADRAWRKATAVAGINQAALDGPFKLRLADVGERLKTAWRNWKRVKALDDIRVAASVLVNGKADWSKIANDYQALFAGWDLDLAGANARRVGGRIARDPLRYVLVAALDHWAENLGRDDPLLAAILLAARQADPDPWRDRVRDRETWQDPARLERLAAEVEPRHHSPQVLGLLSSYLSGEKAIKLMRRTLLAHPQDFWLIFQLSNALPNPAEQIGCFLAALAVRPDSALAHLNLGVALHSAGNLTEAIEAYRQAIALYPHYANAHTKSLSDKCP
jgi:serine/threonine-protein kinase